MEGKGTEANRDRKLTEGGRGAEQERDTDVGRKAGKKMSGWRKEQSSTEEKERDEKG